MKPLAIIIPVKPPEQGKSRLAGALLPHDRLALNRALLKHTFDVAAELRDLADVFVVSKSHDVRAEAVARGFATCNEPDSCDLNGAIAIGAADAQCAGATELMVLPVDLPNVSEHGLRKLVMGFQSDLDVLIVSDQAGSGTNVLLWRPIESAVFHYGPASAKVHARSARHLGLRPVVRTDAALSFDIDTPADLEAWMRGGRAALRAGAGN
ncbi:MAG: 2-phospho-L-lactate guanylyltransferase [Tardiphaga sp.]